MSNKKNPLLAAIFNFKNDVIFYVRDNGKIVRVSIPKTEFVSPISVPVFEDYEIIDSGHTGRFGNFEVSAEWVIDFADKKE